MEGQQRVDLSKQLLEPVDDLTVPRSELRPSVDVRRLVNFVLLEPPGDTAGDGVTSAARILPIVQLYERVAKHRPFRRIHRGDIATDAISESHVNIPQMG
jgi:hypothetical protein